MHSRLFRANAVITFAITVLAALCSLASLSETLHQSYPTIDVQVMGIEAFRRNIGGDDEVRLVLNITADFGSVFSWNTKQLFVFLAAEYETPEKSFNEISLWDAILEKEDDAKISRLTRNRYAFVDRGNELRGLKYNLTTSWNVFPITGGIFTDKKVISGFQLPHEYR